jgi:dihydroorotase
MDVAIKNCKLVSNGEDVFRNIYIKKGKIARITTEDISAKEMIDADFNYVLPGMIDSHVHFRDFELGYKEDFFTGSCAAAAGGITTVLDMPNTKPPVINEESLRLRRDVAKQSIVNYGFHFGSVRDNNVDEIRKAKGVASTKLFMNISTGNMLIEDRSLIEDIFNSSRMVVVHASEDKVEEAVFHSKESGKKLYLCHISLKSEIDFLRENKSENIFVEVTPHHLFLTEKDVKKLKSFGKMMPPLRKKKDKDSLWDGIDDGTVDTIGTDHAPHTIKEKKSKNFPVGVPGCETVLPLLLDAVNSNKLSLSQVARLTSRNPAKIFGIKNKGLLAVGYDADLIIVDMELEKKVDNKALRTKCGWSPFHGKILKGWPIMTIVGGNVVFDGSDINDIKAKEVDFHE